MLKQRFWKVLAIFSSVCFFADLLLRHTERNPLRINPIFFDDSKLIMAIVVSRILMVCYYVDTFFNENIYLNIID